MVDPIFNEDSLQLRKYAIIGRDFVAFLMKHREANTSFDRMVDALNGNADREPPKSMAEMKSNYQIMAESTELRRVATQMYEVLLTEVDLFIASQVTHIQQGDHQNGQ